MSDFKFTPPDVKINPAPFKAVAAAVAPAVRTTKNMPLTTLRCKHLNGSALTPDERIRAAQLAQELDADGILSDDNRTWLIGQGISWEV